MFQLPSKVEILILLFTFFQFYSVVSRDSKVDNFASSLFLLIIIRSGLLAEIRWSACMSNKSCLVLYSFCANLLHSLIMWLMVSSLSPHSLPLLFCCVISILAWIWLVLTALSCAVIRRDSVSLLRFPFLSLVMFSGVRCCLLDV